MKKVILFHLQGCPYCAETRRWIEELRSENPAFQTVEIEMIEERAHPVIAWRHDYWYVPTFYVDGEKLHEGACTREKVERILTIASEEP